MPNDEKKWEKVFYTEDCPIGTDLRGGMFYRTMKLGQFIKETEEKGYRIVGLRVDEGNNGELIFIPPEGSGDV